MTTEGNNIMAALTARQADRLSRQRTVAELTQRGWSTRQIASYVGVHVRTVEHDRQRTRTSDSARYRPRLADDVLARLNALADDGAPQEEIARTLGIHSKTVNRYRPDAAWSVEQSSEFKRDLALIAARARS